MHNMAKKTSMKLTKADRELLRVKFGGRCAYCGDPLGETWHADHFRPVKRIIQYVSGKGAVTTSECYHTARHCLDNMMPACPPCNIDKHSMDIEDWRRKLQDATNVLERNSPTYRHAKRFKLLHETGVSVTFYFEAQKPDTYIDNKSHG